MEALIVVDVQNDFCPGGALAVPDGDGVVDCINALMDEIPFVVATRDWHPPEHSSFGSLGGPWPAHCVAGSRGAELHPGLDSGRIDTVIDKGQGRDDDGYSGFAGTALERVLRDHAVDTVHVTGLALDYCVRATALDARKAGFSVVLHRAATRAIGAHEGDEERALDELRSAGVAVLG
jgi:nicotinamidase-related amidase